MERFGPREHRKRRSHPNIYDQTEIASDIQEISLVDLGITSRVANSLEERGVYNARQLARMTRVQLREIPNIGEQTITDCRRILDKLKIPHPNWRPPHKHKRRKK